MTSLGQRLQQFNLIVKRNSGHVVVWIIDRCFSAHQRILTGRILIEGELGCQNYEPTGTKTNSSKGKRSIAFYNNSVPTFYFYFFFQMGTEFSYMSAWRKEIKEARKKNKKLKVKGPSCQHAWLAPGCCQAERFLFHLNWCWLERHPALSQRLPSCEVILPS